MGLCSMHEVISSNLIGSIVQKKNSLYKWAEIARKVMFDLLYAFVSKDDEDLLMFFYVFCERNVENKKLEMKM
jgi:hypothetical protein